MENFIFCAVRLQITENQFQVILEKSRVHKKIEPIAAPLLDTPATESINSSKKKCFSDKIRNLCRFIIMIQIYEHIHAPLSQGPSECMSEPARVYSLVHNRKRSTSWIRQIFVKRFTLSSCLFS